MSVSPQDAITIFFTVTPDNGLCFDPSEVILWFISMIVISCTWSLLLGSLDFRKHLRRKNETVIKSESVNLFFNIFGSLLWNIIMSVVTAYFLTAGGPGSSSPLRYLLMAWFARPLPGAATLLASVFDYNAFEDNFEEILIVDSLYGVFPIYLFCSVASQSWNFSARARQYLSEDKLYQSGLVLLRWGAGVDILAWTLLLLSAWIIYGGEKGGKSQTRMVFLPLCVLRCLGGGLLWAGSVKLSPAHFCPTKSMIKKIMILWTIVPLVDVLWRGFWGADRKKDKRRRWAT